MIRDEEGHREYKVQHLVEADPTDGPANVLQTPGLPLPGSLWIVDNDVDIWAWCRFNTDVRLHPDYREGEKAKWWIVEQTFGTKPPPLQRCQDQQFDDPLLEPPKISGEFVKRSEETVRDRFGAPVINSAWEQLRGPQIEFDVSSPAVRIEQNVARLGLELFGPMVNTVNAFPLWGLPRRCIKLSNVSWERKYYGQCYPYYTRTLEFEINVTSDENGLLVSGFDRELLDEGTKALNGHWDDASGNWVIDNIGGSAPSRFNPSHFIRVKDRQGENMRVVLDGLGKPINKKVMGTITDVSQGTPMIVTSAGHGLSTNDIVAITQVVGIPEVNDEWQITVVSTNAFSLNGSVASGVYGGGGVWQNVGATGPGKVRVEKYSESNFLLLGIPIIL